MDDSRASEEIIIVAPIHDQH